MHPLGEKTLLDFSHGLPCDFRALFRVLHWQLHLAAHCYCLDLFGAHNTSQPSPTQTVTVLGHDIAVEHQVLRGRADTGNLCTIVTACLLNFLLSLVGILAPKAAGIFKVGSAVLDIDVNWLG